MSYVKNILTFKNLSPRDKDFILNNFTSVDSSSHDILPLNLKFDFNRIISEPKTPKECPKEFITNDSSCWFNWRAWRIKYWGTKHEADDCHIEIKDNSIVFVFTTFGTEPYFIYEALAKNYKDLSIDIKFIDWDDDDYYGWLESDGSGSLNDLNELGILDDVESFRHIVATY